MAYTSINDPSAHYQGLTYTGDSSSTTSADRDLTNTGNSNLQPDFIWLFNRDTALTGGQKIFDSTRGAGSGNSLSSSLSNAEGYNDSLYGFVNSFNSDGFGVRAGSDTNRWYVDRGAGGGDRYVAFQWKANGGTTSSNTDGGITTTVQANTTSGFSIVTYTGDGATSQTVGHGLGAVPKMIISKDRGATSNVTNWRVYHESIGNTKYIELNDNDTAKTFDDWGNTSPTSSVYTIGGSGGYRPTNTNSTNYVAYVFAEKQGFSRFGKYIGNGNANGAFVYTGFKPAFLLLKRTDADGYHWRLYSSAQNPTNVLNRRMTPNLNEAEGTHSTDMSLDFLSNGFKFRTGNQINVNNGNYIYMCFAENPFVTSTGIPTTAR